MGVWWGEYPRQWQLSNEEVLGKSRTGFSTLGLGGQDYRKDWNKRKVAGGLGGLPSRVWPFQPARSRVSPAAPKTTSWGRSGVAREEENCLGIPSPAHLRQTVREAGSNLSSFPEDAPKWSVRPQDLFSSRLRPLPASSVPRLPFAWSSGKQPTSGREAVGGAKMAEERLATVSAEILLLSQLPGGTGPPRAEQRG